MFDNGIEKMIGFEKDRLEFSGKEVVMTIHMRDADFYSIRFWEE